ncbi:MAG: hypothetical protein OTJ97_02025, partial [SAR202 cluster bacterium]|nr:hypothetical protein [SAR202 cluster bacterium]
MLRIGQLEARLAGLNEADAENSQIRATVELTERVDAIYGLITGISQAATDTADLAPADGQADEIAQMRVQITSLVNQLDVARNELKDYRARRLGGNLLPRDSCNVLFNKGCSLASTCSHSTSGTRCSL